MNHDESDSDSGPGRDHRSLRLGDLRICKANERVVALTGDHLKSVKRTIELQAETLAEMRSATRLEAYKNAVDEIVSIKHTLVGHKGLMEALISKPFVKGRALVPPEYPENLLLTCQFFFSFEHVFRMRREGLISPDEWAGLSCEIALLLEVPQIRNVWGVAIELGLHTSAFRDAITTHYEQTPPPKSLADPYKSEPLVPNHCFKYFKNEDTPRNNTT